MKFVAQATMASITSLEVHKLVQATDLEMLGHDNADSGLLVLDTLGILERSNIFYQTVEKVELWNPFLAYKYIGVLFSFEFQDRMEFDKASTIAQKNVHVLTPELANTT